MLIKFGGNGEQTYDHKAATDRFIGSRGNKNDVLSIPPDTSNPIDVELRRFAIFNATGRIDLKELFFDKWAIAMTHKGEKVGRIKDLFVSRDVRLKDKYGKDIIVPFECVHTVMESEP